MIDRKRGFFDEARETMKPGDRAAYRAETVRQAVRHAYQSAHPHRIAMGL